MKKNRRKFSLEYKEKIVSEYLQGVSVKELSTREGVEPGQIYSWKSQLERAKRDEHFSELLEAGHSESQARRIMELEDELSAAKAKIADQALAIDLLKKIHPSYQCEKKSSSYSALKKKVTKSKGHVK